MANTPMTNKEFSGWIESTLKDCYDNASRIKYTVKKGYAYTPTGAEKAIWNVMEGYFVVDSFSRKYDAQYWCETWNKEIAEQEANIIGV